MNTNDSPTSCAVCNSTKVKFFKKVDGVDYLTCQRCHCIFADPHLLAKIDAGNPIRDYDDAYWQAELTSAKDRAYGSSLARVAEVILYSRIPIQRFLDVGTGPGFLLDSLSYYLASSTDKFYGIEKYPPPQHMATHKNYVVGEVSDLPMSFQAGCCIEVIEHLTPTMLRALATDIAEKSTPGAIFIFNTGLVEYVRHEDPGYLDPFGRGHIMSWSLDSLKNVFEPAGFVVHAIAGKTWAFCIEYIIGTSTNTSQALSDRIWSPCRENLELLNDPQTGKLMHVLGIDTARAYR